MQYEFVGITPRKEDEIIPQFHDKMIKESHVSVRIYGVANHNHRIALLKRETMS
jgi:hypothetical protein